MSASTRSRPCRCSTTTRRARASSWSDAIAGSTIERLEAIERQRRPLRKIVLSRIEGLLGRTILRRPPPERGARRLLHLGCGDRHFDGWVNADFYRMSDLVRSRRRLPDWMLDAARPWRCPTEHWDAIHSEHTLEHLDYRGAVCALREAHRTLRRGAWLRLVLPSVEAALADPSCPTQAEAIGRLTQTHGHLSVWDADLLCAVLAEIGFERIERASFGRGTEPELVRDLPERAAESFYVEARK